MTVHRNLTGADLHEPKGVETALAGMVYVANGSGSGTWVAATSVITNTAFTTGDTKITFKNAADSGWILWQEGSIGDGSSGATLRANADTSALFTLLWNNYNNANAPVSGGRGASAAADYAAHKTLTLPLGVGRAIGVAGTASGLTARPYGTLVGSETATLVTANLPPYTPVGVVSSSTVSSATQIQSAANGGTGAFATHSTSGGTANMAGILGISINSTFTGSPQGGTSTAFSIMQPTVYMNVMIKL